MSFKSLDGIPSFIAIATQALYTIAPITTLEVTRKNVAFLSRLIPIITLASPITIVPVPIDMSKYLCCCAKMHPLKLQRPLAIARPMIFVMPLSTPIDVTIVSLSPTARSRYPDFVLMYQSSRNFITSVITRMIITFENCAKPPLNTFLTKSLSKSVVILYIGRFALPAIRRFTV